MGTSGFGPRSASSNIWTGFRGGARLIHRRLGVCAEGGGLETPFCARRFAEASVVKIRPASDVFNHSSPAGSEPNAHDSCGR